MQGFIVKYDINMQEKRPKYAIKIPKYAKFNFSKAMYFYMHFMDCD